jgi:hypothetical protein
MSPALGLGITVLALSLNASTLTTSPIPVSGTGVAIMEGGVEVAGFTFAGSNLEGDSVSVLGSVLVGTECMGFPPEIMCSVFGSPDLIVDGFHYEAAHWTNIFQSPEIDFSSPVDISSPSSVTVPLASVFTFGPFTESCENNGGVPPSCGDPFSGGCGSEISGCILTTPFTITPVIVTPVPETSTILLWTGVLCVVGIGRTKIRVMGRPRTGRNRDHQPVSQLPAADKFRLIFPNQ